MGGSYIWNRQLPINPAAARAFTSERPMKALLRKRADAETGFRNCRNSWAKKVGDKTQFGPVSTLINPAVAGPQRPADYAVACKLIVGSGGRRLPLKNA
jgi:hypothetical protein